MKQIGILYDEMHSLIENVAREIESKGGTVTFIHYTQLLFDFDSIGLLEDFSVLYLDRLGEGTQGYTTQLMLLSESRMAHTSVLIVNSPAAYQVARNKALMYQALSKGNVRIPSAEVAYSIKQVERFLNKQSFGSVVVKSLFGHSAEEVYIFPNTPCLQSIEAVLARDGMVVVQQYVARKNRFIWRLDIVDGVVVAGSKDYAYNDDEELPMCNATQGGLSDKCSVGDIPADIVGCAIDAANTLGLVVAGVDLIVDDHGVNYIVEVNPEPDAMGCGRLETAIADYLISKNRGR